MSGYADLYFFADGTFKSPELAAQHAIIVQGGFSTPAIEAERMLRDGGLGAVIAHDWLAKQNPRTGDARPAFPGETEPVITPTTTQEA